MRSPGAAMLWENWRLTRIEAFQRVVQGVVVPAVVLAGAAAFGPIDNGAVRLALGLLVMTHMPLWLSVAKLNGGRFMDGYRPGYPFYFLYTRPIRTFALVGAPMAYLAASGMAAYLLSALVLRAIFGYPFPLLPLAALIAAYHVAQWAAQWGTSNKVVQFIGSAVGGLGFTLLGMYRTREWPARLDVQFVDYAVLAAVCVVSVGLAVAGVARQRRGEARSVTPRTVTRSGFSEWLAGLFRLPCPTLSATRAQIWFELKTSGLPVLVIGVAFAIVIPLLLAVTTRLDVALSAFFTEPATRVVAVLAAMLSVPAVLLLGGNAFGIRARQGRKYANVYEATQAYGTARIAGLKVLVRSACLMAALVAVGTSIWTSASVIPFDVLGDQDTFIEKSRMPVSGWMRTIEGTVRAMSAYELFALAVVAAIVVAVMVTLRAAQPALRARYTRRMNIATWVVLLSAGALVLLVLATRRGIGVELLLNTITATKWIAVAAMTLATAYLLWRVLAEQILTLRQACGAILMSAAFGVAWITVLQAVGVQLSGRPAMDAAWMLSPALLTLMAAVLAPWSLSRVRHT
ncbi:MAG TPA: hypothetical protein VM846_15885 [Vicinamibacterales bacterium]|nr:hypothetical protein [Vicinamibacterales bacterium]